MKYISICSGIEAATVAWRPLGWEAVAFAEIEPFPNAVLAHHYPDVPNLGDISKVDWRKYDGTVDLVVGGTPCQSFSVAGKREGLDGASGLVREYFRLLGDVRPRWFVWENVPGCLSSGGGADFAFILGQWEKLGYHVAWRVLDAQYFGVAQRRRRVFAVGHIADWRYPAAVLFESGCMSGHPAPRRQAGKENPGGVAAGVGTAKPLLTKDRHNAGDENLVLAKCLTSRNQRLDWETETLVLSDQGGGVMGISHDVTATLRAQTHGHEPIVFEPGVMSRDGGHVYDGVAPTLRAEPGDNRPAVAIPINTQIATRHNKLGERTGLGIGGQGDPAYTLQSGHEHDVFCIAGNTIDRQIQNGGNGAGFQPEISYTLNTIDRHAVCVFAQNQRNEIRDLGNAAGALQAQPGMKQQTYVCAPVAPTIGASGLPYSRPGNERVETEALCWKDMQVRRLTPLECERLQGFPDGYTDIEFKGKPAPDGARYKALGNSMAVPCMRWIGKRIQMMEAILWSRQETT